MFYCYSAACYYRPTISAACLLMACDVPWLTYFQHAICRCTHIRSMRCPQLTHSVTPLRALSQPSQARYTPATLSLKLRAQLAQALQDYVSNWLGFGAPSPKRAPRSHEGLGLLGWGLAPAKPKKQCSHHSPISQSCPPLHTRGLRQVYRARGLVKYLPLPAHART